MRREKEKRERERGREREESYGMGKERGVSSREAKNKIVRR